MRHRFSKFKAIAFVYRSVFSLQHLAQPLHPAEPCGVCTQACIWSWCDKYRNRVHGPRTAQNVDDEGV